eukprot:Gb_04440 [translate_table: standard]
MVCMAIVTSGLRILTLEEESSSFNHQAQQQQVVTKVTWKEGTVDNKFMQRKISKKCYIFYKQTSFHEDDNMDEDEGHGSKKGKGVANDANNNNQCEHGEISAHNVGHYLLP